MAAEKQAHHASSCLSYDLLCFWLENINNFKVSDAHGVQSVRKSQACKLVLVDCRCRTAGIGLPTFLDNASQQKYQQTSQQIQQQQMDMQAHASAVWNLSEWGYVPANGKKTTRLRGQNVGQKDGMLPFWDYPNSGQCIPIVSSLLGTPIYLQLASYRWAPTNPFLPPLRLQGQLPWMPLDAIKLQPSWPVNHQQLTQINMPLPRNKGF